jgi:hypothetical protein
MDNDMQLVTTKVLSCGQRWYLNGELHRVGAPAIEWIDGDCHWYWRDKVHRTDGPAVEWPNGDKEWYLDGQEVTVDEWLEQNPDMTGEEKVMYKLEYG